MSGQLSFTNNNWIEQFSTAKAVLHEKMTLFWHGHFACIERSPDLAIELNNVTRKHAMGNFRDLLIGISKTPAMLRFLNNQQNNPNKLTQLLKK